MLFEDHSPSSEEASWAAQTTTMCTPMHTPYVAGDGGPGAPKLTPRVAKPLPDWEGQRLLASLCGSAISLGCQPLSPPRVPSCQWHLASPATCYPENCCFSSWTSTSLLPLCWRLASPASILSRPCDQSHFSNTNWIVSLWLQSLPRGQVPTPRPGPSRLAHRLPPLVGCPSPQGGPLSGQAPAHLQPLPLRLPGVSSSCSEFLLILQGSNFTS